MRLYTFTNYYLSSIQQGIQPAHCIADMFVKYIDDSPERAVLYDWATNHKTMVCLNGGNAAGVCTVYQTLIPLAQSLKLPFGNFYEDEQSLDNTMTCCGIVIPAPIYEASAAFRTKSDVLSSFMSTDEISLAMLLCDYGLAK